MMGALEFDAATGLGFGDATRIAEARSETLQIDCKRCRSTTSKSVVLQSAWLQLPATPTSTQPRR